MTMTKRERVRATLNNQEADRVPMHINGSKWVVAKLKKALNVTTDKEVLEKLNIDIYDTCGIDLKSGIAPKYIGPENPFFEQGSSEWGGNISRLWHIKETECLTAAGWNYACEDGEMEEAEDIEDLEEFNWPKVEWFDFSDVRERLQEFKDFSIMASGCSVFQHLTYVRGMQELMCDLAAEPEIAEYLFQKISDFYYDYYSKYFEVAGDMIDSFALADDLGTQTSTLISKDMYRRYVMPHMKRMSDLAHKYDMKLILHTCGRVQEWIPELIESGVDVLDPLQPECMNPVEVVTAFKGQMMFRGGISVQQTMVNGTPEDVDAEVKMVVEGCKPGGGYILSPGHPVLQDDVSAENIIAMYNAGIKYGKY